MTDIYEPPETDLEVTKQPLLWGFQYTFTVHDLHEFFLVNRLRSEHWHAGAEPWTLADWGNALGGEAGELQNVIKKIRRLQTSTGGRRSEADLSELVTKAMEEASDVLMYLDLIVEQLQMLWDVEPEAFIFTPRDLLMAAVEKFNKTSTEMDMPIFMRLHTPHQTYPRQEGDVTVIGPECFKQDDVICHRGENYVNQDSHPFEIRTQATSCSCGGSEAYMIYLGGVGRMLGCTCHNNLTDLLLKLLRA